MVTVSHGNREASGFGVLSSRTSGGILDAGAKALEPLVKVHVAQHFTTTQGVQSTDISFRTVPTHDLYNLADQCLLLPPSFVE